LDDTPQEHWLKATDMVQMLVTDKDVSHRGRRIAGRDQLPDHVQATPGVEQNWAFIRRAARSDKQTGLVPPLVRGATGSQQSNPWAARHAHSLRRSGCPPNEGVHRTLPQLFRLRQETGDAGVEVVGEALDAGSSRVPHTR
jgi:hypothetical protein